MISIVSLVSGQLDKYTITANADDEVEVYLDGLLLGRASLHSDHLLHVNVNICSRLIAFVATDWGVPTYKYGLIASLGPNDIAVTGDGSFRCIRSESVTGTDWRTNPG